MEDDFEENENSQKRSVKKWTEEEVSSCFMIIVVCRAILCVLDAFF